MAVINTGADSKTGFVLDVLIALQTMTEDCESWQKFICNGRSLHTQGKMARLAINRNTREVVLSQNTDPIDDQVRFAGMISDGEIHELRYWSGIAVDIGAVCSKSTIESLRTDLAEGRLIPYYEETRLEDWDNSFSGEYNYRHSSGDIQMSTWFADMALPALVKANAPISIAEDIAYVLCMKHLSKLGNLATKFGLRIANAYSKSGGELSYKWFVERFELNVISRYSYEDSCWMTSHLIEYAIDGEPIWKLVDELISLAERYKLNIWNKNSLFRYGP